MTFAILSYCLKKEVNELYYILTFLNVLYDVKLKEFLEGTIDSNNSPKK